MSFHVCLIAMWVPRLLPLLNVRRRLRIDCIRSDCLLQLVLEVSQWGLKVSWQRLVPSCWRLAFAAPVGALGLCALVLGHSAPSWCIFSTTRQASRYPLPRLHCLPALSAVHVSCAQLLLLQSLFHQPVCTRGNASTAPGRGGGGGPVAARRSAAKRPTGGPPSRPCCVGATSFKRSERRRSSHSDRCLSHQSRKRRGCGESPASVPTGRSAAKRAAGRGTAVPPVDGPRPV